MLRSVGIRGVVAAVACVACARPAPPRAAIAIACPDDLHAESLSSVRGFEAWCEDDAGQRAGAFERHLPAGRLVERAAYADGVLDGEYASWYPDGARHASGRYARGKREGAWHAWHENGKPWLEGAYADGERSGPWVEYDYTGDKMFEGTYVHGKLEGAWRTYRSGGAEGSHGTSRGGLLEGELERVMPDGYRIHEMRRANRLNGTVTVYKPDGSVEEVLEFKDGVEVKGSDAPK